MEPLKHPPSPGELRALAADVAVLGGISGITDYCQAGMTGRQCENLTWALDWIADHVKDEMCMATLYGIRHAFCGPKEDRDIGAIEYTQPFLPMVVHLLHSAAHWVSSQRVESTGKIVYLRPGIKEKGGQHE